MRTARVSTGPLIIAHSLVKVHYIDLGLLQGPLKELQKIVCYREFECFRGPKNSGMKLII